MIMSSIEARAEVFVSAAEKKNQEDHETSEDETDEQKAAR
jgi:hypothetical protein